MANVALVKHENDDVLMNNTSGHTCPADQGELSRMSEVRLVILYTSYDCLNLTVAMVKHILINIILDHACPSDLGNLVEGVR